MAHAEKVFKENFLEYASYVIKDRAIPDIVDGLKPVQRRILHTLFELDDGKFHKVANVIGHTMRYHPHGDASIGDALVNLANMELFIEKQGNFGNILTGDAAAAPRYIECRILPFAKKVLYNPDLTEMVDSYDGRNQEPIVFPAKLPVVLIQGAEGIAVGMSTRILPHNLMEVIEAMEASLKGKKFTLYPDFPSGGLMDISSYEDGSGRVLLRAKLNTRDPKRIVIEELPYGVSSERMIRSIEDAGRKGHLRIASINDYTAEKVSIEIALARNTYSDDVVDALYAHTECERFISANLLVIKDNTPTIMTTTEIITYHTQYMLEVLERELRLERSRLLDKLHYRTLERIFIEERIYKRIEQKRTQADVEKAVITGFAPFKEQLIRELKDEDVERLLKIPIRRISLFDIEKNRTDIEEIQKAIEAVDWKLAHLVEYALEYLGEVKKMAQEEHKQRRTTLESFSRTCVREVTQRDLSLRYDPKTGYLGYDMRTGNEVLTVSPYDRVLIIQKEGSYFVTDAPEKLFVGKGMRYCGFADKETMEEIVFTIIYQEKSLKYLFIKRCKITQFILNRTYELLPSQELYKLHSLSTLDDARITILYKKGKGYKNMEDRTWFSRFLIKGVRANGVRLTTKEAQSIRIKKENDPHAEEQEPSLFKDIDPFDDKIENSDDE